jgi:hypothetical protein
LDDQVGKQRGAGEKQAGAKDDVFFGAEFLKDLDKKTDQREIECNREQSIRIVIEIKVFSGGVSIVKENSKSQQISDCGSCHVKV